MFRFGKTKFFSRRRPLGMCFFADEAGDGGTNVGDGGGGAGSSRNDMTGAGANAGSSSENTASIFSLPEAYKDKPYLKDVKTIDDVYKKLDGAQSLLGKRSVPDYKTAKDEDWEEYFSKIRPDGGKYSINEEGVFEGLRGNTEFTRGLEGVFNKAGLSQKQVDILMCPKNGYSSFVMGHIAKINGQIKAEESAADEQFDGLAAKVFGDRKDEAIKNAVDLLGEARNQLGLNDDLDKMVSSNPDALVNLAQRLDYIHRTYVANDTLDKKRSNGSSNSSNSNDPVALQSALDKYKSDNWNIYSDTNHSRYPEVMRTVQTMTDQLMKISSLK